MDGLARAGTKHQQHRARKSPGWDYFEHVAKMQQLVAVADGLKNARRHPGQRQVRWRTRSRFCTSASTPCAAS
jgi:hypothetical protein